MLELLKLFSFFGMRPTFRSSVLRDGSDERAPQI